MKKRTIRWDRLVPPGMNGRREAGQLAAGLAAGLVWKQVNLKMLYYKLPAYVRRSSRNQEVRMRD